MMYILQANKPTKEWHVGEEFPRITSEVVQFIVDGDELMFIVAALNQKEIPVAINYEGVVCLIGKCGKCSACIVDREEPCGVAHEQEILKDVLKGL